MSRLAGHECSNSGTDGQRPRRSHHFQRFAQTSRDRRAVLVFMDSTHLIAALLLAFPQADSHWRRFGRAKKGGSRDGRGRQQLAL
jgi:hypothetical protein